MVSKNRDRGKNDIRNIKKVEEENNNKKRESWEIWTAEKKGKKRNWGEWQLILENSFWCRIKKLRRNSSTDIKYLNSDNDKK